MAELFQEIVSHCAVETGLTSLDMPGVVMRLLAAMAQHGDFDAARIETVAAEVLQREALSSTVLPQGVAIPHTHTDAVTRLHAAIGVSAESGLELGAPDGPTRLVVLVLSPIDASTQHLQFMAGLSRRLLRDDLAQHFAGTKTANHVRKLLLG